MFKDQTFDINQIEELEIKLAYTPDKLKPAELDLLDLYDFQQDLICRAIKEEHREFFDDYELDEEIVCLNMNELRHLLMEQ